MNLQQDHTTQVPPSTAAGFISSIMKGLSSVPITLIQMHDCSKSKLFCVSGLFCFVFNMGACGTHLVIMIPESSVNGAAVTCQGSYRWTRRLVTVTPADAQSGPLLPP